MFWLRKPPAISLRSGGTSRRKSSGEIAGRVEAVIRGKCVYLAEFPNSGHWRPDLTAAHVRFFRCTPIYLIVYRPETRPLQIAAILHANRDVAKILPGRV